MREGERQVAPRIEDIRRDHVARYEWVAKFVQPGDRVVDLACGIGYGSKILAEAGAFVGAIDKDAEALAYGRQHYAHDRIQQWRSDAGADLDLRANTFDTAVCFETVEHVQDPLPLLKRLRKVARRLYASVPNEAVFPWRGTAFHYRHYTRNQFEALLAEAGWKVVEWHGQAGPESEVEPDVEGRTLIAVCERAKPRKIKRPPESVAILGLGPSLAAYVDLAKRLGARGKLADEIWGINALGDIIACDRIFHMDDVRIQEARAEARPESNIAAMLGWLKRHPGPIYTSRPHEDYPGLVAYPLADVINSTGYAYFNNTAAYAVAYAVHLGVRKISLFGCDFTYPKAHDAEKGRGCVEWWLGFAAARGIKIAMPPSTSLMDALVPPDERLYGYDTVRVQLRERGGRTRVKFLPREEIPTADEIEDRYDHSQHPNALAKG